LHYIRDYPPKTDILTGGKGGYGGVGAPIWGGGPHAKGEALDIFIYPHPLLTYPQVINVDKMWRETE